jgi:hypothetical protein
LGSACAIIINIPSTAKHRVPRQPKPLPKPGASSFYDAHYFPQTRCLPVSRRGDLGTVEWMTGLSDDSVQNQRAGRAVPSSSRSSIQPSVNTSPSEREAAVRGRPGESVLCTLQGKTDMTLAHRTRVDKKQKRMAS